MPDEPLDLPKLQALAALTDDDLGRSEEDLKIRFAVPLLEALGHTRLHFEHRGKDILLCDGLPRGSVVVFETKSPDVALDPHLAQLERYANEERALVAVITNGHRVRIYSPSWRAPRTFADALLWDIPRRDLANPRHMADLANVLSHAALAGRWAVAAMLGRQASIEGTWHAAEGIRREHRDRRKHLEQRLREIARETATLAAEQRRCEQELGQIVPHERTEVRDLFERAAAPIIPTGQFSDIFSEPSDGEARRPPLRHWRKPKGPEWLEDDFRKNATPYQQRIFAVFVRLGKRSLGIKQIAEGAGFNAQTAATALSSFTRLATKWKREPLFEVQKCSVHEHACLGRVYTIAQRHWPTIQRLYRDAAPRKRAKK